MSYVWIIATRSNYQLNKYYLKCAATAHQKRFNNIIVHLWIYIQFQNRFIFWNCRQRCSSGASSPAPSLSSVGGSRSSSSAAGSCRPSDLPSSPSSSRSFPRARGAASSPCCSRACSGKSASIGDGVERLFVQNAVHDINSCKPWNHEYEQFDTTSNIQS